MHFKLIIAFVDDDRTPVVMQAARDARAAFGNEALRYAIVAALGFYLLAGLFMALAGKALRRGWGSA